ncbi:YqeG family HAD IIIA-type phosphatase [bacterium]|nr:YqeG family HAD IIIA-type phosphatase [bacterium]
MIIKPDYDVESLFDIDFDELKSKGIKVIMFDLDSTVMPSKSGQFPSEVLDLFRKLEEKGFLLSIVSNNHRKEYMEKVRSQVDFTVIEKAKKPDTKIIKKFLSSKNISPKEAVLIGDRPLTDILAGKFSGAMTILVDSITKDKENKLTRIVRAIERSVIKK